MLHTKLGGITVKFRLFILLIFIPLIMFGCQSPHENSDEDLIIYTSIYPLQFIAEQITGNTATVSSIYPPGVDAHSYEPTTKEITDIARSDVFIYLGANMEGFAEATVQALQSHHIIFIELGKHSELFLHHQNNGEDSHSDLDPHIWLDPLRMIDMASLIKEELIELAPEHEDLFENNFNALQQELHELDDLFLKTLETKSRKDIIVAHAAYGYWEERYDIKQIPISGISAGGEPSQKELTEIVELAKEKNIEYVIFEQNSSDRVSTIIKEHLGADALYLHNLEVLTDEDIENNEDYLSLMHGNLKVLTQATD